jgi:hypothetical protein
MKHFLDIENTLWDDQEEGSTRAFESEFEGVTVSVTLQWHKGGWNQVHKVTVESKQGIRDNLLESLPTIVRRTQTDIEGTRKAVQLLRGDLSKLFQAKRGYLGMYWESDDDNARAIVAFRLQELLAQDRVKDYRNRAFELLQNPNNPISLSTFNRLVTKGRNLEARRTTSTKTPNTKAKKGSAK